MSSGRQKHRGIQSRGSARCSEGLPGMFEHCGSLVEVCPKGRRWVLPFSTLGDPDFVQRRDKPCQSTGTLCFQKSWGLGPGFGCVAVISYWTFVATSLGPLKSGYAGTGSAPDLQNSPPALPRRLCSPMDSCLGSSRDLDQWAHCPQGCSSRVAPGRDPAQKLI